MMIRLRVAEGRPAEVCAVDAPTQIAEHAIQRGGVFRTHEHVDITARRCRRTYRDFDRVTLDVEQIDTMTPSEHLHGSPPEMQPHDRRHRCERGIPRSAHAGGSAATASGAGIAQAVSAAARPVARFRLLPLA
ncbi:hypothetical protein GCM10010932_15930 [Agromyces flavus]|nr:hypothetical protein GCM10010932_15930 [Agromyces flavus]